MLKPATYYRDYRASLALARCGFLSPTERAEAKEAAAHAYNLYLASRRRHALREALRLQGV